MSLIHDNRFFALDKISYTSYGVVVSHVNRGIDCSNMTHITDFVIESNLPDGTECYAAFCDDGTNWYSLDADGNAQIFSDSVPDFDALKEHGNTIAFLEILDNIPAFAGKLIRVAAGLSSVDPQNARPAVKFSVLGHYGTQAASFTEYSPVYSLGNNAVISAIPFDTELSDGGTVTISAKIWDENNDESEWLPVSKVTGRNAKSVQLRAEYYSPNLGVSSAKISQLYVQYFRNSSGAPLSHGRIYSISQDWYMNIKSARISVRHSPLELSSLKVYTAFRKSPGHVIKHTLGISPATKKTFELPEKSGIRYDTFKLYADNLPLMSFELNSEAGRVTLSAPEGSVISCSYEYGWDKETWREMNLDSRYSLDDYDTSEYSITVDDNNYSVAAFMIETLTTSGTTEDEILGTASGIIQSFTLKKRAQKINSISYGTSSAVEGSIEPSNALLSHDGRIIRVAAPIGKTIRAGYDWLSENVQIYQVSAVYYD